MNNSQQEEIKLNIKELFLKKVIINIPSKAVDFCFPRSFKTGASDSFSGMPYIIGQDNFRKSLLAFRFYNHQPS